MLKCHAETARRTPTGTRSIGDRRNGNPNNPNNASNGTANATTSGSMPNRPSRSTQ